MLTPDQIYDILLESALNRYVRKNPNVSSCSVSVCAKNMPKTIFVGLFNTEYLLGL